MAWNNKGAASGAASGAATGTAISPGWGTLIGGAAGGILGGMYTDDGSAAYAAQQDLMEQTLNELEGIPLPELEKIAYENPRWLEDLIAEKQQQSEMGNISVDPRLKNQQLAAMGALDDIVGAGGMTAQDEANLSRIQNEAATADQGRRQAIMQNMDQRGMGGSGMELLNKLQSSQAATTRQSQQGLDVAGMAQQRALDALMQSGNMAGEMRGQEFGEQSRIAQAKDAINRFNTANQMRTREYNVGGRQRAADMSNDLRNKATLYNKQIPQQNFGNQMDIAAARGQARGQNIGMLGEKRREDLQTQANQMGAITQLGTAVASSDWGDDEKKKNNQSGVIQ